MSPDGVQVYPRNSCRVCYPWVLCDVPVHERDHERGGAVELNSAISLVIQPSGKGKKPRDVTDELTQKLGWTEGE